MPYERSSLPHYNGSHYFYRRDVYLAELEIAFSFFHGVSRGPRVRLGNLHAKILAVSCHPPFPGAIWVLLIFPRTLPNEIDSAILLQLTCVLAGSSIFSLLLFFYVLRNFTVWHWHNVECKTCAAFHRMCL